MNYKFLIIPLLLFLLIVAISMLKSTTAYFTDTVSVSDNTFTMGIWTTPILTPTPTTIPTPAAGDVVINELMWMGSTLSFVDEWIELKNNITSSAIDLTGWTIEEAGETPNETITLSGTIPSNDYFLITNYAANHENAAILNSITVNLVNNNLSLDNDGEQLILKDQYGNIIDSTPAGNWPAGINTSLKQSMQRINPSGEGTNVSNWITCSFASCNDGIYWDTNDGDNYGTPKANNIYE